MFAPASLLAVELPDDLTTTTAIHTNGVGSNTTTEKSTIPQTPTPKTEAPQHEMMEEPQTHDAAPHDSVNTETTTTTTTTGQGAAAPVDERREWPDETIGVAPIVDADASRVNEEVVAPAALEALVQAVQGITKHAHTQYAAASTCATTVCTAFTI